VNARDLPWRRTRDPYAIWIAEIMLQQTRVTTAIAYWQRWMQALPDVRAFARASPAQARKLWEGLGITRGCATRTRRRASWWRSMAANSQEHSRRPLPCRELADIRGGVCSIAYNQPTAVLDGM